MYLSLHNFLEELRSERADTEISESIRRRYWSGLKDLRLGDKIGFGRHSVTESVKPIGDDAIKRTITWEVIDNQDDRLLLLSEYVLDWEMFNDGYEEWEDSYIREQLNGEWCDAWFTETEKQLLFPNPDPVFLLSVEEARKYFGGTRRGRAVMLISEFERFGPGEDDWAVQLCEWDTEWWLRTPGTERGTAYVDMAGNIDEKGFNSSADEFGIRPAIWLDLNRLRALLAQ